VPLTRPLLVLRVPVLLVSWPSLCCKYRRSLFASCAGHAMTAVGRHLFGTLIVWIQTQCLGLLGRYLMYGSDHARLGVRCIRLVGLATQRIYLGTLVVRSRIVYYSDAECACFREVSE
jgi:hypothetical protein